METVNFGLAGGKLDATEHIEAARERTCFPSEIAAVRRAEIEAYAISSPGIDSAEQN